MKETSMSQETLSMQDLRRHAYYAEMIGSIHGCSLLKITKKLAYKDAATGKEFIIEELKIRGRSLCLFKQDFIVNLLSQGGEPNKNIFEDVLAEQRNHANAALHIHKSVLLEEVSLFTETDKFHHVDLDASYVAQMMQSLKEGISIANIPPVNKIKNRFMQAMKDEHDRVCSKDVPRESPMFKMEPFQGRVYAHLSVDINETMTMNKGSVMVQGTVPDSVMINLPGRRMGDIVTCPPHVENRIIAKAFNTESDQDIIGFKLEKLPIAYTEVMEMKNETLLDRLDSILGIESNMARNSYTQN